MKLLTKYHRWYYAIIDRARDRCNKWFGSWRYDWHSQPRDLNGRWKQGRLKRPLYVERHHIVPKSLGGNNDKSNLIELTYREHFLVHWLLIKMHKGINRRKMQHALHMMCSPLKWRIIAAWQYEVAKIEHIRGIKGSKSKLKGRKLSVGLRAKLRAVHLGQKVSPETRVKIGVASKARKRSAEWCAKISAALKGKKLSAEHRANLSISHKGQKSWMKGRKHSAESLAKIRAALKGSKRKVWNKGLKMSAEYCAKLSAAHIGHKNSPEACAKISAANKGKKRSAKQCSNIKNGQKLSVKYRDRWKNNKAIGMTGKTHSEEARAKMSAAHKGIKLSAKHRANLIAALRSTEVRAKISAKLKGRKLPPEVCAKLKGRKLPPEVCAKMSARMKGNQYARRTWR